MAKYFVFFKREFVNVVDVDISCIIKTCTKCSCLLSLIIKTMGYSLFGAGKAQMRNCIFGV